MRINVGCGAYPAPGWLNIDGHHPSADLAWDAAAGLPPTDEPIERIYAGHVLEHMPYDALPGVLARWRQHPQVTAATRLAVVGPDIDLGRAMHAAGAISDDTLADIGVGGQHRWPGDDHLWESTAERTVAALTDGGWTPHAVTLRQLAADGWPLTSLIGWQFALLAAPA